MFLSIADEFLSVKCAFQSVRRCCRRSMMKFRRSNVRFRRSNDVFVHQNWFLNGEDCVLVVETIDRNKVFVVKSCFCRSTVCFCGSSLPFGRSNDVSDDRKGCFVGKMCDLVYQTTFLSIDDWFSLAKCVCVLSIKRCFCRSKVSFRRSGVRFSRLNDFFVDRKWVFVGKVCCLFGEAMFSTIESESSSMKRYFRRSTIKFGRWSFRFSWWDVCFRRSTVSFHRWSVVDRRWASVGEESISVRKTMFLSIHDEVSYVKFAFLNVKRCLCWSTIGFVGLVCVLVDAQFFRRSKMILLQ